MRFGGWWSDWVLVVDRMRTLEQSLVQLRQPRNAQLVVTRDCIRMSNKFALHRRCSQLPSMATGASSPGPYAVIDAYEIVARVNRVVAICLAPDELFVDENATIAALMVCA